MQTVRGRMNALRPQVDGTGTGQAEISFFDLHGFAEDGLQLRGGLGGGITRPQEKMAAHDGATNDKDQGDATDEQPTLHALHDRGLYGGVQAWPSRRWY